ncbi:hypothetical protein G7046_g178 [Stylonectria norvegica]|nr:hypothetical protein G7046_g178 [Stylonectria norvegica]
MLGPGQGFGVGLATTRSSYSKLLYHVISPVLSFSLRTLAARRSPRAKHTLMDPFHSSSSSGSSDIVEGAQAASQQTVPGRQRCPSPGIASGDAAAGHSGGAQGSSSSAWPLIISTAQTPRLTACRDDSV